jgi:hypothetical protein
MESNLSAPSPQARALPAANPSEAGGEPDGLNDVAALLAEQLSACHAAAARCFAIANDEEDFQLPARMDALKLATRLVQASAAAASAVKRLKGGEFHHHVTVNRIDYGAEKAARKARERSAKNEKGDPVKLLQAEVTRILEHERRGLTAAEQAAIDDIRAKAAKRPYGFSSEAEADPGEDTV